MTDKDFEQAKAEIIQKLGKPEYEMNCPINDSAKAIQTLVHQKRRETFANNRRSAKEKGQQQAPETLTDFTGQRSTERDFPKNYKMIPTPIISLSEEDLKPFSKKEQEVLIDRYDNLELTVKQLAIKHGITIQKLTSFLNSIQVKMLQERIFRSFTPFQTQITLWRLLKSSDSKTAMRLAEEFKLISAEKLDLNVLSKPIDDPAAIKILKDIGDQLSNNSTNISNE